MGLLDTLAGQILGSLTNANNGQQSALLEAIGGMLTQQPAGLAGLVAAFNEQGLGGAMASWISTGQNETISPTQLQSVLGSDQLSAIAAKLGFSTDEASGHLAALLPQVIDKLTPDGKLPDAGALAGLLGLLQGKA